MFKLKNTINQFSLNKSYSLKNDISSQIKKFSTNKINKSKDNTNQEKILIFSHETARRYYKLNVLSLGGYFIVCFCLLSNHDYPDHLWKTTLAFGFASFSILVGIYIFSNRHINLIRLLKPSNNLTIRTFSKLTFGLDKEYQIPLKNVELIKLKRFQISKKTNLYILHDKSKKKYFSFLNFFYIRPTSNPQFDSIFKSRTKN